jgi:hypothetical protein
MSNAFLLRMPAGIAGDVTRREAAVIEAQQLDASSNVATVFGIPLTMASGKLQKITGSQVIYGFLVRPYPTQGLTNEALGTSTPSLVLLANVLRKGYMTVKCTTGTPAKNGAVYVNTSTGLIQTTASTAIIVPNCYFMGTGDANGFVEISFGIGL